MNGKSHALGISVIAGIIAMALVITVLILHAFDSSTASDEHAGMSTSASSGQDSAGSSSGSGAHMMPDGSMMSMEDMPGMEGMGDMSAAGEGAGTDTASPAEGEQATGHSMGGSVDWQVIGLILALVSTGIALGGGLKEYLRRQIALGRAVDRGLQHE